MKPRPDLAGSADPLEVQEELCLAPRLAELSWRLARSFALVFAAVALGLALLRRLSPVWLDSPALGPLTWGELALLLLYPTLCVVVAALELQRRGDARPDRGDARPDAAASATSDAAAPAKPPEGAGVAR